MIRNQIVHWLGATAAALLLLSLAACTRAPATAIDPRTLDWPAVEQAARGRSLSFVMWTGDPAINAYIDGFLKPRLKARYDIDLNVVPGQADIANRLIAERDAGQTISRMDMVWINGETFHKLRQLDALYGPFTDRLPNSALIDWDNPVIARDFQQPVAGYEAPWGTTQLLLIADTARVVERPETPAALARWIHDHPGRFTFDAAFTGLSFLKSLMYAFADSPDALAGPFDEARYQRLKTQVFDWVRAVRPDLWRQGKTFPKDVAQLHQLFASGEIDFTMSFNDGEVDNKVASGLFPDSARAYPLSTGMLANSHYLGIVASSAKKAAAMVVINELISAEAQFEKLKPAVWGDGTVLDVARLPTPWPARYAAIPGRGRAPPRAALRGIARQEPSPTLMIRLEQDFRDEIVRQ